MLKFYLSLKKTFWSQKMDIQLFLRIEVLFAWTLEIWVFRAPFRPKLLKQMMHWCCFRFSWTHSMCFLRSLFKKDENSHKSHLQGRLFSWTIWTWIFRVPFSPKLFWQMLHWCCLSFSWTHSMCFLNEVCWKDKKSHKWHL